MNGGMQAPPGNLPPAVRGGGTPAWCLFDGAERLEPSLSYTSISKHVKRPKTDKQYISVPNIRRYSPSLVFRD